MIREDQTNQIRDLVAVSQTALVIVSPDATLDQVASAAALALSLEGMGKQVSFLSPKPLNVGENLYGMDQLQTELGNQDLTVSFPYNPESVDKVSYHIDEDNEKFYLVIKPQKGSKPLDTAAVEYSYTGAIADLIFLVGIHTFESLEQLYFGYESLYGAVPVITFHTFEPSIGSIKIDVSGTSSFSESMGSFLFAIGAAPVAEAATDLLAAIEDATDNFRSLSTTAETFDMVAYLLRQGARRQKKSAQSQPSTPIAMQQPTKSVAPVGNSFADALKDKKKTAPNANNERQNSNPKKGKSKTGDLHHQPSGFSPSGGG